jgi:DNA-binding MarR family transcriptional regulator
VTRIYDRELRKANIEITQFGLLTALATLGEANQKTLSAGFAMDSTSLTRTLALLRKRHWIRVKLGKDRRERVFRLSDAETEEMAAAQRHWEEAERQLRKALGERAFNDIRSMVSKATIASMGL